MADILTDEQVAELAEIRAFAEGKAGIFMNTSHMAILLLKYADLQTEKPRHVQVENGDLRNQCEQFQTELWNSLRNLEQLQQENARLQAENERLKDDRDIFIKSYHEERRKCRKAKQENAHLREALEDVKQTLLAEKDIWNESLVNGLAETIDKALATEGEGNG